MRKLILFDIDGTLVDCGSQVRVLFQNAMFEAFGTYGGLETVDFAGKTDPGIGLTGKVDRLQPSVGAEGLEHGVLEEDPDLGAAVDQGAVDVEEDELPHEVPGAGL